MSCPAQLCLLRVEPGDEAIESGRRRGRGLSPAQLSGYRCRTLPKAAPLVSASRRIGVPVLGLRGGVVEHVLDAVDNRSRSVRRPVDGAFAVKRQCGRHVDGCGDYSFVRRCDFNVIHCLQPVPQCPLDGAAVGAAFGLHRLRGEKNCRSPDRLLELTGPRPPAMLQLGKAAGVRKPTNQFQHLGGEGVRLTYDRFGPLASGGVQNT